MNKHTVVAVLATIAIVGTVGFSAWNVAAADQIQIKAINEGYFSYFDLINNPKIMICNPTPLPVNFDEIRISMVYDGQNIGIVHFPVKSLDSNSETKLEGSLNTEQFKQLQYLGLHFDAMYNDVIPSRIPLKTVNIVTEINSKILGLIPYSTTKEHPGVNFWYLMDNKESTYTC